MLEEDRLDGRLLPAEDLDRLPEDREPADGDRELPDEDRVRPADERELPVEERELPAEGALRDGARLGLFPIDLDEPLLREPTVDLLEPLGGTTIGRDPDTLPEPLLGATNWRPPALAPDGASVVLEGEVLRVDGR